MTDEEMAEKYAIEDLPDGYKEINYVKKQSYLDGLVEGKKESAKDIDVLTKENEQLKCDLYNTNANLQHITIEDEKEITELKVQNKGLIHLLESIQSAVSGIKKNKDKEIVLYWIEENAIRVFKQEKQKGFSFDWLK